MAQKKTLTPMQKREKAFRKRIDELAKKIKDVINTGGNKEISITINYVQYLHSTDATRLTKVTRKTPPRKSRIKCILTLHCPRKKLNNYHIAEINNIIMTRWKFSDPYDPDVEYSSDKCSIIFFVDPHNVK